MSDNGTGRRPHKTAKEERARILHEVGRGTFVTSAPTTVSQLINTYLAQSTRDVEAGTASNYRHALAPVREYLGERRVQTLREEDVDALVDRMLTTGRKRGGKPGTGLSARTVSLTLGQLRAALNLAIRRQLVVRNVALDTKIPRAARKADAARRAERMPWTANEVRTFLAAIRTDRLYAPILLGMLGLRPAEVCGLKWDQVDLTRKQLTISVTRTMVDGEATEKDPKTAAGRRTLPLPEVATAALRDHRKRQTEEKLAAGGAYVGQNYVLCDELGEPFKTDQMRRRLYKLMTSAGVRKVRPYDARHSCLTYLAASGVPDVVVSAWAGHADLSLAKRVYVHPDASHLAPAAERLNLLLGGEATTATGTA